jgi:hypothetical protein
MPQQDALPIKERWDRLDACEAQHEAEGSPAGQTPRDGKSQPQLAKETGRSQQTVGNWIAAHRKFGPTTTTGLPLFDEAVRIATWSGKDAKSASQLRSQARKALREQSDVLVPDVAKEFSENAEVREKVLAAMATEAKEALNAGAKDPEREAATVTAEALDAAPSTVARSRRSAVKAAKQAARKVIDDGGTTDKAREAALGAADVCALPILKYGVVHDPADDELFRRILAEHLPIADRCPRLEAWVRRIDGLPRAASSRSPVAWSGSRLAAATPRRARRRARAPSPSCPPAAPC